METTIKKVSVRKQIEEIMTARQGEPFIMADFEQLGCYNTIKSAIQRLVKAGVVTKLMRGFYAVLRYNRILKKKAMVSFDKILNKLKERYGWAISAYGDAAVNGVGLCVQVPARVEYASNGPTKTIKCQGVEFKFKHVNTKKMGFKQPALEVLIQAIEGFKNLKGSITKFEDIDFSRMRNFVKIKQIDFLIEDKIKSLPVWLKSVLFKLEKTTNQ